MNTLYALFDPASKYSVLRATLLPREKIRGYFHWRRTQRDRGLEEPGPSPDRPPLVFRGGSPPTRLKASVNIPTALQLDDHYTLSVTLEGDAPAGEVPCRAFLIEQAVLDRLRQRPAPAVVCREGDLITLRDLSTGQIRASVKAPEIRAAAVLSDDRVAFQTDSGDVRVWNTVSGNLETWVEARAEDGNYGLAVSSAGLVAWGNAAGQVLGLDSATGTRRFIHQHLAPVTLLAALADGRFVSAHAADVPCLCSGEAVCKAPDTAPIASMTPVGKDRVAFCTIDGNLYLWSADSGKVETLPGRFAHVTSLPDGRLAAAGPGGVALWDWERSSKPQMLTDAPATKVLAAPGPRLVKVAEDESLWVWNLATGTERLLQPHQSGQTYVEPLVCGSLRPSLPADNEVALEYLLDHRVLSEEFAVQQALSALPELDGMLRGKRITLEGEIPSGSPNISARAWVVVVIGPPAFAQ